MAKLCFLVLKVFGLACYSVDAKTKSIRTTLFDKILFVTTVLLWTSLIWLQLRHKLIFDKSDVKKWFISNLWMYSIITQHFFGLAVVVNNFMLRTRIEKLLKIIRDFDQKLLRCGWKSNSQEKLFRNASVVFLIFLLLTTAYILANVVRRWTNQQFFDQTELLRDINDAFILLFNVSVSGQFAVCALSIRLRLANLNMDLR